jgi:hypothetical protein
VYPSHPRRNVTDGRIHRAGRESMSLTRHLDNVASPVGRYVKFVATIVDGAKRGSPFERELKTLLGLDARPKLVVPAVAGANAGTVGAAFDYRARYELGPCRSDKFVANLARVRLPPDLAPLLAMMEDFFTDLDTFAERTQPWRTRLDPEDDWLLARYCVVLALLESVYRIGQVRFDLAPARKGGLLALVSDLAAEDVMNLGRLAAGTLRELTRTPQVYIPNPTFAGSAEVGGADADFILADSLWELKTTKNLDGAAIRNSALQLVGYALLDFDDAFVIRGVCAYFARYDYLWALPLWALVFPPVQAITWLQSDTEPDETEVAERLAKLRGLMHRAASGEVLDYEVEFSG